MTGAGFDPQGSHGPVRELSVYLVAFVVYVAIGVAVPEFMFTSIVAIAYVLVATWLVPSLVRRLP